MFHGVIIINFLRKVLSQETDGNYTQFNVPQLILCYTDSDSLRLGTVTNVRMTVKISMEI
jgi:hypothetical protein